MTQGDRELIERLRGLLANATPGPWYTLDAPWLPSGSETSILAESPDPHVARFICDFDIWALDDDEGRKSENPDDDAALIVAAVNELPGLLDRLQALSAEVEKNVAEIAALKASLKPTESDIQLAEGLRAGCLDEMEVELAAQRIEQGQYYDCGDFGHVIENQRLSAEVERYRAALGRIAQRDIAGLAEYTPQAMVAIATQALKGANND